MFGRFFTPKSRILPTPLKNQIEVVCPACGAAQYEPRLVVSTLCKKCGAHLTIQKRRVTAFHVSRSGVGCQDLSAGDSPEVNILPSSMLEQDTPSPDGPASKPSEAFSQEYQKADVSTTDGLGAFLKAPMQSEAHGKVCHADPDGMSNTGGLKAPSADPSVVSSSPCPSPSSPASARSPLSASSIQKMKDLGTYRDPYFKEAECFDCSHKFKTSRSVRTVNCPICSACISFEDVEINMNATQPVRTRGDVIIRKRGHLVTSSLQCRNLKCFGILEANLECGGDAIFRTSGTVMGEIRCRRLIVEKGSDLVFKNSIRAEEVEIHARMIGTLFSSGSVVIRTNGAVNGDVTARSVSIEPGGELNGAINILRAKPAPVTS